MDQIVPAFIGAVAALLANLAERVFVWVFDKSQKREAQRDADLAMIERVIFEVRDLAKEYWQLSGRLPADESSITGRLQYLGANIDSLYNPNIESLRKMQVAMNRLDVACTAGSFQTNSRMAEPNRCAALETAAYHLLHLAQTERRKL